MGRIKSVLSTKDVVTNAIETYIHDATSTYYNFLETAPTFVTYYSRSMYKSTYDESFIAYNEVAGEESPNKFHKIENLPIYSLDTTDFNTELADDGWTGELNSSCIILPNTVVPKPDDLIEISIHSKKFLFQVTNGIGDNYGNQKFYKVNFRLSQYTKVEVEKLVDEELEVDFTLLGKSDTTVLKKSYKQYIEALRKKYDELLEAYTYTYYDKLSQSFVDKSLNLVDQYLNRFIVKNELNKPFIAYRNSSIVSTLLEKYVDRKYYNNSIYNAIENSNYLEITSASLPIYKNDLKRVEKYTFNYYNPVRFNMVRTNDLYLIKEDFRIDLSMLKEKDLLNSNIKLFLEYVNMFSDNTENKEEVLLKLIHMMQDLEPNFYTSMEELKNGYSIPSYYSTPFLLFAIKHSIELLINKQV